MRTVIQGGRVIDPAREIDSVMDVVLENGKILGFNLPQQEGDRLFDASGKIVCPGFVDIHAHEDPMENGRCAEAESDANLACLLRMGVTTALVGNCGENVCDPVEYLAMAEQNGGYVDTVMLAGYTYYREKYSQADRYTPVSDRECEAISAALQEAMDQGCAGVSFGLEYVPGMAENELLCAAQACSKGKKLIAAHIRACAEQAPAAAMEVINAGKRAGVSVQISHIGSMAGYGQMEAFLRCIDQERANGTDVTCDCYPYHAFSTTIGSAPYDDLAAIHCSWEDIEMSEGEYRGQRCTQEIFERERRDHPDYLTVGHVMDEADIRLAYLHPGVLVGSDCYLNHGQGHPRAAGAFPRFLSRYCGEGGLSLPEGIRRMTALPAQRLGLSRKGTLCPGADADLVIFDPVQIRDCATFSSPTLPPAGIEAVFLHGEIAVENGRIVCGNLGRAIRR